MAARQRRWLRWAFRVPMFAFDAGLGRLFRGRLVLVEHIGRHTGRQYRAVVEVVDRDEATGTLTVASGFGPGADWYRNLLVRPRTHVVLDNRPLPVRAQVVPAATGARIMRDYAQHHRFMAKRVVRMLGHRVTGTDAEYAAIGRTIPFLRLEPDHHGSPGPGSAATDRAA